MSSRVALLAIAAGLLGACRGTVDTPLPVATEAVGFVEQACAGTTFDHCMEDVTFAIETYPTGKQLAICDAGDGKGSVVALAAGKTAEEACSTDAIDPGNVVRVVALP